MSNLGALLAQQSSGGQSAGRNSGGGSRFSFEGGQSNETPEDFAALGVQEEERLDASSELFASFTVPASNADPANQQKALPYKGGEQQNPNAASLADLQQMWAQGNAESNVGEAADPQKQLSDFNTFISEQAKTLDFFPAERQQKLATAFESANVADIAKTVNEAMQDMAINVMNTAFALVQQEGAKIRDSAVETANSVRTKETAEASLLSQLPERFTADPFTKQFALAQLQQSYNKTRNYASAVELSVKAIEAITRAAGGGSSVRPGSSNGFGGGSQTAQGARVQKMMSVDFAGVMGGLKSR